MKYCSDKPGRPVPVVSALEQIQAGGLHAVSMDIIVRYMERLENDVTKANEILAAVRKAVPPGHDLPTSSIKLDVVEPLQREAVAFTDCAATRGEFADEDGCSGRYSS